MASARTLAACLALASLAVASVNGMSLRPVTADACQTCMVSVRILEDFLCDPAATDFLVDFVEKRVCPVVGDGPKCHNLAEGLVPTVVQWFRSTATPASLCSASGVCGASILEEPRLNRPALRVKDNAECAMCKFVVTRVKVAINNSQTLEKVKEVALQVCSSLPTELAESCTDFVNNYEPVIADLIEDMDPDYVCSLLGVCMEAWTHVQLPPVPAGLMTALSSLQSIHPMGPMGPGGMMRGPHFGPGGGAMRGPHPILDGPMPMALPGGASNDACDYCKMAVIEAHSLISNPDVQNEVLNYTKAVCENFPSFVEACKTYVDEYAPLAFSLMEEYLVPDLLCSQIGMCPPSTLLGRMAAQLGLGEQATQRLGGAASLLTHNLQRLGSMAADKLNEALGLGGGSDEALEVEEEPRGPYRRSRVYRRGM